MYFLVSFFSFGSCLFLIRETNAFIIGGNPTAFKNNCSTLVHQRQREDSLPRNDFLRREPTPLMRTTFALGSNQDGIDDNSGMRIPSIFSQNADAAYSDLVIRYAKEKIDEIEAPNSNPSTDGWLDLDSIKGGWVDLKEMIDDGDLSTDELDQLFEDAVSKSQKLDGNKNQKFIDRGGFFVLYQSINALFELEEEEVERNRDELAPAVPNSEPSISSMKDVLLSYLMEVHSDNKKKFPCGFDCSDNERELIHEMINALEKNEASNFVLFNQGKIDSSQMMGEWDLLYTSSRTMTINKSLSGLGRTSSSKAQFESLRKSLTGSKYLGKIAYTETFGGEEASFDVSVTGEWMLEDRRNTFTGMPSTSLRVDPEKVMYGPTTNQADEWASLGPIKLLDILYLDADLMLLRGNANVDSLFVYQRSKES